jgi:transposase
MAMPANNDEELSRVREAFAQMQSSFEALKAEHETLRGELRTTRTERDLLKERLRSLMHKLFAAKSEARGSEQRDLFLNEAEALVLATVEPALEEELASVTTVGAHTRARRGRKPLDPALPREVVRHELPEAQRVCPHDGSVLTEIGVEASEQLDIIPQQVRVLRHERVKYACPCCDRSLKVTPTPARIIPKGLFTESALAWIISAKYQDGLPLYRQAAILGRFGGEVSRNTLAASVVRVGEAIQPIINLLRDTMLEAELVLGDETELQVLKEPGRAATQKSYLWAQMSGSGPPIHLFTYDPSRSGATALQLYRGMKPKSVLLTDGYETYEQVAKSFELVHLGCWAHVRRRFIEAEAALPKNARTPEQPATQFVQAIGALYAVEAKAREQKMTPADRKALRHQRSAPAIATIQGLLLQHLPTVLPESLLGKALRYLNDQWPKLVRFLEDGRYPIDNNLCENAIRPFVVGRKNWLFCDTQSGARASANLYSLIETAKANAVEPYRYLQELFSELPRARTLEDYEALLPWRLAIEPQ